MAIVQDTCYNLNDYAKQFDASGQELAIAEVLTQRNDILQDMPVVESNSDSGHEFAVRTGIPEGTWRAAYEGVQPVKATTKVISKPYGVLTANSEVDALVAEKGGNVRAVRSGQAKAIIGGMSNGMAKNLIYGDSGNKKAFEGLASYYNRLSGADSASQLVNAGGSGNKNTSIYLVVWSPETVYGFFPKGTRAGLRRIDYSPNGPIDIKAAKGGSFPGYMEHFEWKMGFAVQDYRYAGRVANIDLSSIKGADLLDAMLELESKIQDFNSGSACWYMNRQAKFKVRQAISEKGNVQFAPWEPCGKDVMIFSERPVRVCDAISNTEETVS